jgi:hypothetical protein
MGFLTRIAGGLAVHGYFTAKRGDRSGPQSLGLATASNRSGEFCLAGFHHLHSCHCRFTIHASALMMSRLALGLSR